MKDFINKLQNDLKGLQEAIKKDSDELLKKVKTYATAENLRSAGAEIEKLMEQRLKKFEPTVNKVVEEIRKSASKAGINVDDLETKVRRTVKKAASQFRKATTKKGSFTSKASEVASKAADKAQNVAKKASAAAKKAVHSASSKPAAKKPARKRVVKATRRRA
jgi:hypothetical protein